MPTGPLRHLIISREFPPAAYPPGGIGTYVAHIARLLAGAGETVHVIGERWSGAPLEHESFCDGRLVVHRVRLDQPLSAGDAPGSTARELRLLGASPFPAQRFAWQAALLAEALVEREGIEVIEAQEWEAPLYYFLLRRALGVGPTRQPPCMIHLHSPSELIFRHNEWAGRPEYLSMIRLEEYCICAADALLCPSRYLAQQVSARYGVPLNEIGVIPYPLGDSAFVPRTPAVWRGGRIAYIGRLEPRKGVIEFVDAAVLVAQENEAAHFDFVGDDVRYPGSVTVRGYMESRIPRALRKRFRFHGVQPRANLPALLAGARAAVIPSRWENFPNTCIEAMCSGLPVIASPNGGMVEMLEDGVTGWIADSQSPEGLADALRRALATPAAQCAAMGRAAAEAIQGRCGNEVTTRRHLAKRAEVARAGVVYSGRLPEQPGHPSPPTARAPGLGSAGGRHGLAIVVDATDGRSPTRALESIARLLERPRAVTVVRGAPGDPGQVGTLSQAISSLIEQEKVSGVVLLPGTTALAPEFSSLCQAALEHSPELGVISCWVDDGTGGSVRPCPAFPYQWMGNDADEVAVMRAEAFSAANGLREALPLPYARWDLCNAILAAGWRAVTYPAVLATRRGSLAAKGQDAPENDALHRLLRERFPAEFARDAALLASLLPTRSDGHIVRVRDVLRLPVRSQVSLAVDAVRQPRRALGWLRARWERMRP